MDTTKETLKAIGVEYYYDKAKAKAYNDSRKNKKGK